MDLVDFALYHVLSIHSHPNTGIATLKEINGIHPKVALYDRIYQPLNNKYNIPSLETTAINTCVLAKTINKLNLSRDNFTNSMYLSLEYQLYYCMENISPNNLHISTLSALIESCINISSLIDQIDIPLGNITSDKIDMWIHSLRSNLVKVIHKDINSVYDLTYASRALYLLNAYTTRYEHDEILTMLPLEILDRRNELGFLEVSPLDRRIAPLSYQLFAIETLLISYSHIGLDTIREETLDLFDKIYQLSYNPAAGFFSFQRGANIRYTAKDLGLIIRSLNTISKWTEEKQYNLSFIEEKSYMKIILDFMKQYKTPITNTIYIYSHSGSSHRKLVSPLFPSRLLISPPYHTIDWQRYREKNLNYILHLCNCLLDIHEIPQTDISPSHIDTLIDMLLGILS